MKSSSRQNQTNLNSNDPNVSSGSINCPNQVVNNKIKITDTKDKR